MSMGTNTQREAMIEVGRRIWVRGFAAANDGNLSIRLDDDRYLTTATGSSIATLRAIPAWLTV